MYKKNLHSDINVFSFQDKMNDSHSLVEKVMMSWDEHSNEIAVIGYEKKFTYGELSKLVNKVVDNLYQQNVTKISIVTDRSIELIALVMGAIKAGVTFSLIDPDYPLTKINSLIERFDPEMVFTKSNTFYQFKGKHICWGNYHEFIKLISDTSKNVVHNVFSKNDAAYVTFTSGSTGVPKKLTGGASALLHFLNWSKFAFHYDKHQRFACLSGISHDPFLRDILVPLSLGKTIFIPDELSLLLNNNGLVKWLREEKIEVIHITSPLMRLLTAQSKIAQQDLPDLKLVLSGGDKLLYSEVQIFKNIASNARIFNVYGATETPQIIAYHEVNDKRDYPGDIVPIGLAAPGFDIILDEKQQIVVRSQYLVQEIQKAGEYKSGDIGRINEYGELICTGRNLGFIQHNGYRIDVKEIENLIYDMLEVSSIRICLHQEQLELFLFPKNENHHYSEKKIKQALSLKLPKYSVPNKIYFVEVSDLNANQKIDFTRTRDRYKELYKNGDNPIIEKISETVGVYLSDEESLMTLGIDSLKLAQLSCMLKNEYSIDLMPLELIAFKSIALLTSYIEQHAKISEIAPLALLSRPLKISPDQQGLLLENHINHFGLYNLYAVYELDGEIDLIRLKAAFEKVVMTHDVLRYNVFDDGAFIINEMPVFEWKEFEKTEVAYMASKALMSFINKPFILSSEPLLRLGILSSAIQNKIILVMVLPHLLSDGSSQNKIIQTLMEAYKDNDTPLKKEHPTYQAYLNFLHNMSNRYFDKNERYWENKVNHFSFMQLPYDHYDVNKLRDGEMYHFQLDKDKTNLLKEYCLEHRLTLQASVLTVLYALLWLYTDTDNISMGIVFNGRVSQEFNELVGFAINTTMLQINFDETESLSSLTKKVKNELNETFKHQFYPFVLIKKMINMISKQDKPIQVMFNYEKEDEVQYTLEKISLTRLKFHNGSAKFPITFYVRETKNHLEIDLEYSQGLFKRQTIESLSKAFLTMLDLFLIQSEERLNQLPVFSLFHDKEPIPQDAIVHHYNEQYDYLYDPFVMSARNHPDKIAVIASDGELTYRALLELSQKLASGLKKLGVRPNQLVGVYLSKGLNQVIASLGIMMSGAAYLPISFEEAQDRVETILTQGHVEIVLTQSSVSHLINENKYKIFNLDKSHSLMDEYTPGIVDHQTTDLAYVIFTSGSTGMPKGVMIEHKAALNTIQDINERFKIQAEDKVYGLSNLNFDLSVYDLFGTLAAGATLVLADEEARKDPSAWVNDIQQYGISIWNSVPALMQMLCDYAKSERLNHLNTLRLVLLSGDWIPLKLPEQIQTLCSQSTQIISLGGATEASIWSILYPIEKVDSNWKSIPYGQAMWNQQFHILNDSFQVLPVGVIGELFISGAGLARGYWQDEERTQASFIMDPMGKRLYRTGDLGRYLENGMIEFLGRKDHQIKMRGYRIELGEIESQLEKIDDIEQAAVVERAGNLFAYYVSKNNLDSLLLAKILKTKLPDYMIPSAFKQLDTFPLTVNGKIDRKKLPQIEINEVSVYEAPQGASEILLAGIWQELLKIKKISRNDHFFLLGGHSLQVLELSLKLKERLGHSISLKSIFTTPILHELAKIISIDTNVMSLLVKQYEKNEVYPLSFVQSRLWFLEKLVPGNGAYTITSIHRLRGMLHVDILEKSLELVAKKHAILRTVMVDTEQGAQRVLNQNIIQLNTLDWSGKKYNKDQLELHLKAFSNMVATQEYHFETEPLWRAYLINDNALSHSLVFNFHHLIADGISIDIFVKELAAQYDFLLSHSSDSAEESDYSYGDYTISLKEDENRKLIAQQQNYWVEKLSNFKNYRLNLPSDHVRPSQFTFKGKTISFLIEENTVNLVDRLTRKLQCTRSTVFLAVYHLLLHRLSGQEDILTGMMVANRNHPVLKNVIGYFANTLLTKSEFNRDRKLSDYIHVLHQSLLDDFSHQEVAFEKVVEALASGIDHSTSPIFQHMYVYQQLENRDLTLNGIEVEKIDFDSDRAKFDLTLSLEDYGNRVLAKIEYYSDLFLEQTIHHFIDAYIRLLDQVVQSPEADISTFSLLSEYDRENLLLWNDTEHAFEDDSRLLFESFIKKAQQFPDKIAVIAEDGQLSYQTLLTHSMKLAHYLRSLGALPNTLVGVYLSKSTHQAIAVLGIMMSGAAYLPISVYEADQRIEHILSEGEVQIILTHSELRAHLDQEKYQVISLNETSLFSSRPVNELKLINKASDLAYVIFTSGSTGIPKGVMIEHAAALNTIKDITERFSVNENDTIYGLSNLNFDLSVYDFFGAFSTGATLILPSEEARKEPSIWMNEIIQYGVTIWNTVPALMQMLCDYVLSEEAISLSSIRLVLLSGDWISLKLPEQIRFITANKTDVISLGGATEAAIWSILYPIKAQQADWKTIPYGHPMWNQTFHILNDSLEPTPVGVVGELYIGGKGLARGYWKDDTRTEASFITHPRTQERLYKTGDLGRYNEMGVIEFLGRKDHQIKIRGYRVELGEIEAQLENCQSIDRAVVIERNGQLFAYVIANEAIDQDLLLESLKTKLPDYMLPAAIIQLSEIPLSFNGKIDRKALPNISLKQAHRHELPVGELETCIANIWSSVLNIEKIYRTDNFFSLGGHSLLALSVMNKLKATLSLTIPLKVLFQAKNLTDFVMRVKQLKAESDNTNTVTIIEGVL